MPLMLFIENYANRYLANYINVRLTVRSGQSEMEALKTKFSEFRIEVREPVVLDDDIDAEKEEHDHSELVSDDIAMTNSPLTKTAGGASIGLLKRVRQISHSSDSANSHSPRSTIQEKATVQTISLEKSFEDDIDIFLQRLDSFRLMEVSALKALIAARLRMRLGELVTQRNSSHESHVGGEESERALFEKIQREIEDAKKSELRVRINARRNACQSAEFEPTLNFLLACNANVFEFFRDFELAISDGRNAMVATALQKGIRETSELKKLLLQGMTSENLKITDKPADLPSNVFRVIQKSMIDYILLSFDRENKPPHLTGMAASLASSAKCIARRVLTGMTWAYDAFSVASSTTSALNPLAISIEKREFALEVMVRIWAIPCLEESTKNEGLQRSAYLVALYDELLHIFVDARALRDAEVPVPDMIRSASAMIGLGTGEALEDHLRKALDEIQKLPGFDSCHMNWASINAPVAAESRKAPSFA